MEQYNASSITVLEGLEAVRKRPGMYIGSTSSRGLNHLIYEIVDNAVDEHLAGFATKIYVLLNKDGSVTVSDNGRGIPVDLHKKGVCAERVIFTTLHAGGKFDNNNYKVSGGLHGVGSSVVNALSSWMEVTVYRNGHIYKDRYEEGKPVKELTNGLLESEGRTKKTGTTIQFFPDSKIFEHLVFKSEAIKQRLHETTYLNPGLEIYFEDKREGSEESILYSEPEGIPAYVKSLTQSKTILTNLIEIHGQENDISIDIALQFTDSLEENLLGYCNCICTTEGGTHITGFKNRFTTIINNYARLLGILKEKDTNFTGTDTRCGMTAIICVKHPDPLFEGQTKTKLGNTDVIKVITSIMNEQLTLYFDRNVEVLKKIISRAELSSKVRKSELKARSGLLSKQKFSIDVHSKLANCEGKDYSKNEIFIVEGDSAGGSAKTARNRKFQAILPIRGKILNVEKSSIDKILANVEIKSMIQAFGCGFSEGYGMDFDIEKLRYNKIIIMTDADVDGAHISTLLLTFFYRFMPELIKSGHVYLAMPPLYKAIPKKGPEEYLYDDFALSRYRKTHKNFILQRYKGLGEMDASQLWETTLNPETRMLKQVQIEDAKEASDVTELLMGNDVSPRRHFIFTNANLAEIDA
ncbi:DNA gyrase subunit B [Lachnospiraceae bacterium TWA4]|nr:DNA gyrase subunit B [Lachnospiraceae bacterium TWA4]